MLTATLRSVRQGEAGAAAPSGAELLKAAKKRLCEGWGELKPLQLLKTGGGSRAGTPAPKAVQQALLSALEKLCMADEAFLPLSPHLLKMLYEEDVVSEEVVLAWATAATVAAAAGGPGARFLKAVQPIISWLQEAESEEDEEDE